MIAARVAIGHPSALYFLIALADIRLAFRPQTFVGLVQTRVPDRSLSLVTFNSSSIRIPSLLDTSIRHDTNAAHRLDRCSRGGRSEAASGTGLFGQNFLFMRAARGVIIRDELETCLNLRSILRPWARRPITLELVDVIIVDSEQSGVGINEMEFDTQPVVSVQIFCSLMFASSKPSAAACLSGSVSLP